jgi:reactive intermediate/imine deaminase
VACNSANEHDRGDDKLKKEAVHTDGAPAAIGTYSQAIRSGNLVFLSGQIPLVPETMALAEGNFEKRARQVFDNLKAVAHAAGGSLNGIVKLTIYLTDLGNFATVNSVMAEYFGEPYPARAAVGVASLPKGADVEAEAILVL